ncbi:hypothetical protein Gotur_033941 [Gossypium turneri]
MTDLFVIVMTDLSVICLTNSEHGILYTRHTAWGWDTTTITVTGGLATYIIRATLLRHCCWQLWCNATDGFVPIILHFAATLISVATGVEIGVLARRQSINMFVNGERSWICLNFNGVVKLDFELVVFGGVLKDRHGGWILGFNKSLGHYSVFNAELWGVLDGLRILQSQNYNGVVIRVDSQEALQAIQESF